VCFRVDPAAKRFLAGDIKDGEVIAVSAGESGLEIGKAKVR
jgi:ATP-dependent Clp protease ATP-binding subunit ClpB